MPQLFHSPPEQWQSRLCARPVQAQGHRHGHAASAEDLPATLRLGESHGVRLHTIAHTMDVSSITTPNVLAQHLTGYTHCQNCPHKWILVHQGEREPQGTRSRQNVAKHSPERSSAGSDVRSAATRWSSCDKPVACCPVLAAASGSLADASTCSMVAISRNRPILAAASRIATCRSAGSETMKRTMRSNHSRSDLDWFCMNTLQDVSRHECARPESGVVFFYCLATACAHTPAIGGAMDRRKPQRSERPLRPPRLKTPQTTRFRLTCKLLLCLRFLGLIPSASQAWLFASEAVRH